MSMFAVMTRNRKLINTDPQRRCYNGCYAKSEIVWTEWDLLEMWTTEDKAKERIKFWESINEIAVEARGEAAVRQFFIDSNHKGWS